MNMTDANILDTQFLSYLYFFYVFIIVMLMKHVLLCLVKYVCIALPSFKSSTTSWAFLVELRKTPQMYKHSENRPVAIQAPGS